MTDAMALFGTKASVLSSKGTVTFKLTDYQKRKVANEVFHSPSFHTSPTGCDMHIRIYPNGSGSADGTINGNGTHVSLFVCILKGHFDKDLK